ncbi:MAG: toxin-antitoxin system YwqK family antitoxin [Bacteroidota bacterium]
MGRGTIYKLILILVLFSCQQEIEREYYTNGSLKFEVPLKAGKRNGKLIQYYKDGKINATGMWKNGKLDGPSVIYFPNGRVNQENNFRKGVICCQSKSYREDDGTLMEIQYFDNRGRMIDYKKVKRNGQQDLNERTRKPIILAESDTVNLGDYFIAEVRLGNKRFNNIEVVLGEKGDPLLFKRQKLQKSDSVTALLKLKADSVGTKVIRGIIFEFRKNTADSILAVPFEHSFYIKGRLVNM